MISPIRYVHDFPPILDPLKMYVLILKKTKNI